MRILSANFLSSTHEVRVSLGGPVYMFRNTFSIIMLYSILYEFTYCMSLYKPGGLGPFSILLTVEDYARP